MLFFLEHPVHIPLILYLRASQVAQWVNESSEDAGDRHGFDPWVGKIPWRRAWQPTAVFLPEELHGRGAWWAAVHRIAKSRTRLKQLRTHACMHFIFS